MHIFIFGGSIAYGAGDTEGGWASRLRTILVKRQSHFLLYNLGVPGDTTDDLRKRFIPELGARIRKDADTIIIFSIGGNDAGFVSDRQEFMVPLERFSENMEWFITEAKKLSSKILIKNLTPVLDG